MLNKLDDLQHQISGLKMSPRLSASAIKSIQNSMFLIFQVSQHCFQLDWDWDWDWDWEHSCWIND